MAGPGDCRVVFSAYPAEELEAAVQAEKDGPGRSAGSDDLLTAAVVGRFWRFLALFARLMKENNLQPVTDPDFELAVNRAEGFRAGRSSSACRARWNWESTPVYPAHPAPAYPGADHRA